MILSRRNRRGRIGAPVAILVGIALVATGCSSTTTDETTADTPADASSGAFPVTIDTAYGEITVDEKPERIVAFSGVYVELLSLVDEDPLAFAGAKQDNDQFLATSPWLAGAYEGEPDPSLVTGEFQVDPEAVAALEPDLILTNIWMTNEESYQQLSEIAPTYVGIETDTNTSWQDLLASIAALTGHDPTILDETEATLDNAFTAASDQLSGLQGSSYQVAILSEPQQLRLSEYGNDAILALGLEPGDNQPLAGEMATNPQIISMENVEQLTADVVFIGAAGSVAGDAIDQFEESLEVDPRVAELPATQNGTLVHLTLAQWLAINGGTPASYTWWLEQIVPQLEESTLNQTTG